DGEAGGEYGTALFAQALQYEAARMAVARHKLARHRQQRLLIYGVGRLAKMLMQHASNGLQCSRGANVDATKWRIAAGQRRQHCHRVFHGAGERGSLEFATVE